MKRQIIGITMAIVLAAGGTWALVAYVQSAKSDAVAGQNPVQVLVVNHAIAKGTAVGDMSTLVTLTDVPQRLVATDAVTDLATLDQTMVAGIDLAVGDQLRTARLLTANALVRVEVPKGLQEVTVALSPERAVGGALVAGDTVGLLFSFQPFEGQPSDTTHFTIHKVLVTAVQFSALDRAALGGDSGSTETTVQVPVAEAPGDQLLVTLAVTAAEAEQVVFASEFGTVWLTGESASATETGTRVLTIADIYVTVARR